ncbi:MAG: HAD-IIIA family hydrolase [Phycisphaeraceae bacterium]|nr:HAD-IIIA family hydrolase [Phycisphaeraceae bacterium]
MINRAIFLDRDNTIIQAMADRSDPEQVSLIKGAASAIASLRGLGYRIIVITNQGGVARGELTEEDVEKVNQRIDELVRQTSNTRIDRFYYCPYDPKGKVERYRKDHPWRKPQPGMILHAANDFKVDLKQSWTVGDSLHDIEAGIAAGTRTILIQTSARNAAQGSAARSPYASGRTTPRRAGAEVGGEAPAGRGEVDLSGPVAPPSTTLSASPEPASESDRPDSDKIIEQARKAGVDFVARSLTEAARLIAQSRRPDTYEPVRTSPANAPARTMPAARASADTKAESASAAPAKAKSPPAADAPVAEQEKTTPDRPGPEATDAKSSEAAEPAAAKAHQPGEETKVGTSAPAAAPRRARAETRAAKSAPAGEGSTAADEAPATTRARKATSTPTDSPDPSKGSGEPDGDNKGEKPSASEVEHTEAKSEPPAGKARARPTPAESSPATDARVDEPVAAPVEALRSAASSQAAARRVDQAAKSPAPADAATEPAVATPATAVSESTTDASTADRIDQPVQVPGSAAAGTGSDQTATRPASDTDDPEHGQDQPGRPGIRARLIPAEQTLREILQEIRHGREDYSEFTWLHAVALFIQLLAIVCIAAGLMLGVGGEDSLFWRWAGVGIFCQLMVIAVLLFRREK